MVRIRLMTLEDIPLGLRLKTQAEWNQTEADWQRMLSLEPTGGFVAEQKDVPVGTTMSVTFGSVAWIAMVLVEESYRKQGIGKALMKAALNGLDRQGVSTVRLDATPLGRPVYEGLGFRPQFELQRWEGVCAPPLYRSQSMLGRSSGLALEPHKVDELCALDLSVTGTDRRKLLERLLTDNPQALEMAVSKGQIEGFGMFRPGSQAVFVGPCVAERYAGSDLLNWLLNATLGSRVFVDIPRDNSAAEFVAHTRGLTVQRPLVRMIRGDEIVEDLGRLWASSGPELG